MDSIPLSKLGPIYVTAGIQTVNTKYATLACYVVLVYDHFLTIRDEINFIWKRRFSFVTLLFFLNRYYAFCAFTINIFMTFSFALDLSQCKRYIHFQPYGEGIPFTFLPDIVIGLRVYALYDRNKVIATVLTLYLVVEFGVSLWLYLTPSIHAVTLPGPEATFLVPALRLCVATRSSSLNNLQSAAFQFLQTIYDSIVFGLILYKTTKHALGLRNIGGIRALMAKHGILYYVVVFSTNFTWAMMILFSPVGLKYSAAAPVLMMACMAVNKLTLALRGYNEPQLAQIASIANGLPGEGKPRLDRRRSWIGTSTFEIGADYLQDSLDLDSFELHTPATSTHVSSGSSTLATKE